MSLAIVVYKTFELIMLVLLLKVFLSWIPSINWRNEPFLTLNKFAELFFGPFRKIVPPIGMIDISPVIAFLALGILQKGLYMLLVQLGL